MSIKILKHYNFYIILSNPKQAIKILKYLWQLICLESTTYLNWLLEIPKILSTFFKKQFTEIIHVIYQRIA